MMEVLTAEQQANYEKLLELATFAGLEVVDIPVVLVTDEDFLPLED